MADPVTIKQDPEGDSPPALDDAYEDVDDLEFYDPTPGDPNDTMYIARVPTYLWQALSQSSSEDSEARIGTIRQFAQPDAQGVARTKLRLLLRSDRADFQGIPKEYELDVANQDIFNTFVFSEQDRPEYAAKNKARAEAIAQGVPAHLLRQNNDRKNEKQPNERGKKGWKEPFRRGVQKKTKIVGRVKHELSSHPVDNPESRNILELRAMQAQEPKATLKILTSANGILMAGTNEANNAFDSFIKNAPIDNKKQDKAKRLENKTARMPENELLDKIVACFQQYKYWSMRALKAAIPQPDQYLRSTLEKVAELHKSGRFANQWSLKLEFSTFRDAAANETAPDADVDVEGDGDGGEDDDADIKMEDVSFV